MRNLKVASIIQPRGRSICSNDALADDGKELGFPASAYVGQRLPKITWDIAQGSRHDIRITYKRYDGKKIEQRTFRHTNVTSPYLFCVPSSWVISGAAFDIAVTAGGTASSSTSWYVPERRVGLYYETQAFEWAFWDDPDARVTWDSIPDVFAYDIDLRYRAFDTRKFREAAAKSNARELNDLKKFLYVKHVPGKTRSNGRHEVTCYVAENSCENHISGKRKGWTPFRYFGDRILGNLHEWLVHSVEPDMYLEARIRALGRGSDGPGPWSDWASMTTGRIAERSSNSRDEISALVCPAFAVYEKVKDIQRWINVAQFVISGASVIGSAISGGSSVPVGAALKSALSKAAQHLIKKGLVSKYLKPAIRDLIAQKFKDVSKVLFKYLAGCLSGALDLKGPASREFWEEILGSSAMDLTEGTVKAFLDDVL